MFKINFKKIKHYEVVMTLLIFIYFIAVIHDALLVPGDGLPTTSIINIVLDVLAMVIVIIMYISVLQDDISINKYRNVFLIVVFAEFFALCTDLYSWILFGRPEYNTFNLIVNTVFYSCGIAISIGYYYFVRLSANSVKVNLRFTDITCNMFAIIAFGLVLINCFTGYYFYIDEYGYYVRNLPLYYLSYFFPFIILLHTEMLILKTDASLKEKLILSNYILVPTIFIVLQVCFFGLSLMYIAIFLSILIVYSQFYLEQTKRIKKQTYEIMNRSRELNEMRTKLVLSQVSPSFIYDGMVEMKRKTKDDPDKAVKAMDNFIGYLVSMINSIGEEGVIPLKEELELTKYYLECECVCFDYALEYSINDGDTECYVPPLSIEPIVEAALNHGIKPKGDRGKIDIIVEDQEKETLIYIIDDGIGYDVEDAKKTYRDGDYGLKRCVDRLVSFKISMDLESEIGKGSKIILKVPKEG